MVDTRLNRFNISVTLSKTPLRPKECRYVEKDLDIINSEVTLEVEWHHVYLAIGQYCHCRRHEMVGL